MGAAAQVFVADLENPAMSAEDAHHLARVLRLRAGETVVVADGEGHWRPCRYVGPGPAPLEAAGAVAWEAPPSQPVTVGFVPVKGERPEWVVQKLTEIGVDRVVVLRSARAVVRWEGDRAPRALERLRRVAREAAAQSRRARLPLVEGVWDLAELGASYGGTLALAEPGGDPPGGELRCLAVGPEGGWLEEELEDRPTVGLGPGLLRAETAAVAAATVLCALRDGLVGPAASVASQASRGV